MNWHTGQPILAIKNSQCGKIKKGQEFIIKGLRECPCNCEQHIQIDVGIIYHSIAPYEKCGGCGCIRLKDPVHWKHEELFAPLDQDISELTEILKTKQPFEV